MALERIFEAKAGAGSVSYLILAHAVDDQLALLTSTLLADPRSLIYLHVDAKTRDLGWLPGNTEKRLVHLKPSVPVNWAGWSVVVATIYLLDEATMKGQADRFVLLSGSCFPLRPVSALNDEILARDTPLVSVWGKIDPELRRNEGMGRYVVTKFYPLDRPLLNPKRNALTELAWNLYKRVNAALPYERKVDVADLWKGSQFFILNRKLAHQCVRQSRELEPPSRHAMAPDEIYFTTHYVRFCREHGLAVAMTQPDATVQGTHYVQKRVPVSRTLRQRLIGRIDLRQMTPADVPQAVASGAMFARKCSAAVSAAIMRTWTAK